MKTNKKVDTLKRIEEFREYKKMTKTALATAIKVDQVTLTNHLLGKRGLSLDVVIAILETYDELSAEWLLRGKESMFIIPNTPIDNIPKNKYKERIEKLIRTIEILQENIDLKSKVIKEYEEDIKNLKEKLEAIKNKRNIG